MEEIFHKLPYNAMARSKLVSKEWNSIISSQKFMDDHYNYCRLTEGNHLIVLTSDTKSWKSNLYTTSYSNLVKEQSLTSMTVPIQNPPKRRIFIGPKIVGSYNGLVALLCYDKLILWNPITKNYSSVSTVGYNPDRCSPSRVLLGLRYDGSTDQYNVVILSHYQSPAVSPTRFDREVYYENTSVFVYNFKDGCERKLSRGSLNKRLLDGKLYNGEIGKVICGFPHWVVTFYDYIDRFAKTEILYFDVNDDKFKQITHPGPGHCGGNKKLLGLASIDDENELGCVLHDVASSSLEVWVMKEYGKSESWTNMLN